MVKISKQTRHRWNERIAYLKNYGLNHLNYWEKTFLENIEKWIEDGKDLTFRQSSKLAKIFKRVEEEIG